jgi:hypothetical protein
MDLQIQIAIVGSSSALIGVLAGSLVSHYSSMAIKRREWNQQQVDRIIDHRTALYTSLLQELSTLTMRVIEQAKLSASSFDKSYLLLSQIQLECGPGEVAKKAHAALTAVRNYWATGLDADEKSVSAARNAGGNQADFITVARADIESLQKNATKLLG